MKRSLEHIEYDENKFKTFEIKQFNRQRNNEFDLPYQNDEEKTVINTDALKRFDDTWDEKHLDILNQYSGQDLLLKGVGYGWWSIIKSSGGRVMEESRKARIEAKKYNN